MQQFFENGYGVSVIDCGYRKEKGLKELAVLTYEKDAYGKIKQTDLCYDTPITDDVLGWLTEDDVKETTEQVKALPSRF